MSMFSLTPATTTLGWLASIATAGSFCLFCENGPGGLPLVTRASPGAAIAGVAANSSRPAARAATNAPFRMSKPPNRDDTVAIQHRPAAVMFATAEDEIEHFVARETA